MTVRVEQQLEILTQESDAESNASNPLMLVESKKISLNKYRPLTLFLVKFSSFQDMKSRFHCNANKLVEILISKKHFPGANRGCPVPAKGTLVELKL